MKEDSTIKTKNSTTILANHFNSQGYRTYWQECREKLVSLGVLLLGPHWEIEELKISYTLHAPNSQCDVLLKTKMTFNLSVMDIRYRYTLTDKLCNFIKIRLSSY
jgi:hypothetical protein